MLRGFWSFGLTAAGMTTDLEDDDEEGVGLDFAVRPAFFFSPAAKSSSGRDMPLGPVF